MAEIEKVEFEFPDEVESKEPEEKVVAAEPEIEIEVEDDTPEEDRNRKPMAKEAVEKLEVEVDELDNYSKEARDKMIKMKKIWNDERRRADQADRERQAALDAAERLHSENKRIKEMLTTGQSEYLTAVKTTAELQLEAAKAAYRDAYESGDTDRVMEAQQQITQATLQMDKIKNFKLPPLQEEKFEVQRQQEQPQVQRPDDKVMDWQSRNPWFGQDEEMTASALGLHEKLKRQGVVIGSDDYYAKLDKTMRKRFPEEFDHEEPEVEVKQKEDVPKAKPSTVVAPATRSTASKKVKLTTSQVAIAKKLGLTPEQYVRELMKMEA